MRAFIALDFSNELKKELHKVQKNVKKDSCKGSWVNYKNFHITLKFLGDIEENKIDSIENAIKAATLNTTPISILLDRLGYFNFRNDQYNVIWIGIKGEIIKINTINDIIEEEMQHIGFPSEKRKFAPHITLGRRVILNRSFDELQFADSEPKPEFMLNNITLMKSEETRGRRIYTPIKVHYFK